MTYYNNPVIIDSCEVDTVIGMEDLDDDLLVDVSYTMSYYPELSAWFSYHDYIPNAIFALRDRIISFKGNDTYIHNQNNRCIFYSGIIRKSAITFVFQSDYRDTNKLYAAWFHNINWRSRVIKDNLPVRNETISNISIHNSYQASKQIDIVPFNSNASAISQYDIANVRLVKNHWSFSKFRNNKISGFINEWFTKKDVINNTAILEAPLNDIVYENDNTPITSRRFIDDYLLVRVEFINDLVKQHIFELFEINVESSLTKR